MWDLGCNTGHFSRIAAKYADYVVAIDSDHSSIERLHRDTREEGNQNILPLVINLANPSPDQGWAGRERQSLPGRGTPDMTMCLPLTPCPFFPSYERA